MQYSMPVGNPDVRLPMVNGATLPSAPTNGDAFDDSYEEMTISEIFNGKVGRYLVIHSTSSDIQSTIITITAILWLSRADSSN